MDLFLFTGDCCLVASFFGVGVRCLGDGDLILDLTAVCLYFGDEDLWFGDTDLRFEDEIFWLGDCGRFLGDGDLFINVDFNLGEASLCLAGDLDLRDFLVGDILVSGCLFCGETDRRLAFLFGDGE